MSGLRGRRVVVTRAAGQASALVELVAAAGAVPVVVPLTEIVPAADGVAALRALVPGTFDWLVVTSPNAAEAYLAEHPLERPASVASVGTATAATLTAAGVAVSLIPTQQRAAGLVEEFPAGPGRVLLVQAIEAEPVLADGLLAKGWDVTVVRPYRAAPLTPGPHERAAALDADAVLLASGSAARAWVAAFGPVAPPVVVAIGPQTAEAATAAGLKVTVVAADHSLPGMVDAVSGVFTSRP